MTDIDTLSDLDNSTLIIIEDSSRYYLSRCQARKNHDSIFMNFTDTNKLSNSYQLEILKANNHFLATCSSTFSITDSSYKRPLLTTYHQIINLDKTDYQVGDSIIGNVSLEISSYNLWPEIYTDTIKIIGGFRAIVR
jgi:hypothetical protein